MSRAFSLLVVGMTVLAGSCASSPPTQFYTLEALPPQHHSAKGPRSAVRVVAVHIPPLLDRDQIVRERAPAELDVNGRHRWGAPLGAMLRDVLTEDLALRLPAGSVILPQQPAPAQTASITVDVLSLEARADGHIDFGGAWSIVSAGSETPSLNQAIRIREPANAQDYGAQARAMSLALGQLADDIVAALTAAPGKPVG